MALYDSDEDGDTLPSLAHDSMSTARGASRRAASRASSVASVTAAGGPASRTARQPSYERGTSASSTSRIASTSRSAGVRRSISASPAQDALESDTPTVAAYMSTATARRNEASQTPSPVARAKPKRAVLDPEAQKQLEQRRQKEQAEDDFFTRKPALTFRTKKAVQKPEPSRGEPSSRSNAGPSQPRLDNPSASPAPSTTIGKARATVIELDSDESSGSSLHDDDDSSGDSDDPYATGTRGASKSKKGKSKKTKQMPIPIIPKFSPVKRQEPDTDSSSSSGYSFTSSSSIQRIKKDKHQGKKKKMPVTKPQPAPKRSLSPIETVDSYVVQHALADLRRKNNARQLQPLDTNSAPVNGMGIAVLNSPLASATSVPIDVNGNHLRSPSAGTSAQADTFQRTASFSLTPMPEVKPQTEAEQEAKFGTAVSIRVEMVYDPRLPMFKSEMVSSYEAPVIVKTRQRETFHRLFEAISKFKNVPQDQLTFTYNGKTVYKSGSPVAVQIISSATFKGYTKDVLSYIRQHPESIGKRQESESRAMNGVGPGPSGTAAPGLHINGEAPSTNPIDVQETSNTDQGGTQAQGASPEAAQSAALRLTIRGGSDQKVLLAVPPNKTVLSVIKHFLRKFNIDQAKAGQCKLLFDGEEIEHDLRLGQTELEDEDTLDIKVPTV